MRWSTICRPLAFVFAFLMLTAAAPAAFAQARQWSIANTSEASYGTDYELYDLDEQLGYQVRDNGPNLGWTGHSGGYFQFMRKAPQNVRDHRRGPIKPVEDVALYNTKARKWLKYQQRDGVAELVWSTTPSYEWRLYEQTPADGRVRFALFNIRKQQFLVRKTRSKGINLGWSSPDGKATGGC